MLVVSKRPHGVPLFLELQQMTSTQEGLVKLIGISVVAVSPLQNCPISIHKCYLISEFLAAGITTVTPATTATTSSTSTASTASGATTATTATAATTVASVSK